MHEMCAKTPMYQIQFAGDDDDDDDDDDAIQLVVMTMMHKFAHKLKYIKSNCWIPKTIPRCVTCLYQLQTKCFIP